MEKQLIKFKEIHHSNELAVANKDLNIYNKLLSDLKPFIAALDIELTTELITALLNNPKEYAFDSVIGQNPLTIGGIPVSKAKAMDFVEMPPAWTSIINLISAFNKGMIELPFYKNNSQGEANYNRITIQYLHLENGLFALTPSFLSDLKEKHSIYTTTEKQNRVLDLLKGIYKNYEELAAIDPFVGITLESVGIIRGVPSGGASAYDGFYPERVLSRIED